MNKKRKAIWDKSGGKCWYCGCDLPEKGWHADHFHPIIRNLEIKDGRFVTGNGSAHDHLDTEENKVPSCAPCNLFKHTFDIEFMRQEIAEQYDRIRKKSPGFRMLERLGKMKPDRSEIVFWFEKQGIKMPTRNEAHGFTDQGASVVWDFDEIDRCYCADILDMTVTLRHVQGLGYLAIATWSDWQQSRTEIPNCSTSDAKKKAADWALSLDDKDS